MKYTDLYPILDTFHTPRPMDTNNILFKYMMYVTLDTGKIVTLFIPYDSMDYSVEQDTISFDAFNMIGVIAKYASVAPTKLNSTNE